MNESTEEEKQKMPSQRKENGKGKGGK